jgi:predicted P-loop ATPase
MRTNEDGFSHFVEVQARYRKHRADRGEVPEPAEPLWEPDPPDDAPFGNSRWLDDCLTDKEAQPFCILANAMIAMRNDPHLIALTAYDEMLRAPLIYRAVPAHGGERPAPLPTPRPMTDADIAAVQEYLQLAGLCHIGREAVGQALDLRARERGFHPVRDYLDRLVWDGVQRVDGWLSTYLGAKRNAYAKAVGRMFLIGMVARIYTPGAKVDHVPVLEGPQGQLKSTACGILAGPWFSDSLPDVMSGKEASQHLRGKWLIEIAELSAINRAEVEYLKSFVSRREERYRPPYGRLEVIEPRQCVFVGTTNRAAYLKDETGGRRFWPVKVGRINIATLSRDRDQIFAEAVMLYRRREPWWPKRAFERKHIKPQQETRFEADAWEDAIRDYLARCKKVQVSEVARKALRFETYRIGTADIRRITAALERLGWTRENDGKPDWQGKRWWVPCQ